MMTLTRDQLYSLEHYARIRPEFRSKVIAHKKNRRVPIGHNAALYFEDAMTMQYQVQEMLRIERIFEERGIQEELDVYNPLIPDGSNWKATFMLEYEDVDERRLALAQLKGIERATWVRVGDCEPVYPIANEDLSRETEDKTASVHFLRFELTPEMVEAAKSGADIVMGITHPQYRAQTVIANEVRGSLLEDLD
jgi:hypothetical protein